ncbi:hypothetical protein CCP2SC5_680007 [Azospirillaceae bacterium]
MFEKFSSSEIGCFCERREERRFLSLVIMILLEKSEAMCQ